MKNPLSFSGYRRIVWFLASAACLLIACKKHPKLSDELNPAFTEKISAFTSGVISAESTIRIILSEDNSHSGEINTPVSEALFRFKPGIKGQTVWVDKRTLEFRPSEPLLSGTLYKASFKLGKLVEVNKDLSEFTFSFSVVEQNWSVEINGYQVHNENDLVWNSIKGTVNTADNIDNEQLKKYFTAHQNDRKLKFTWEPGEDRRTFRFSVDSVRRTEKPGKAVISWDASADFSRIKGSHVTEMPSLSDYKILDIKVIQQPEQYIQIMFSDPIKKNQNFEGLIFLESANSLSFTVSGNLIKAFPAVRQSGSTRLTIRDQLMNILGYELKETIVKDITFEVPKPAIRLTGKGVILPSSKGMIFPFEAINLNAVDVKIVKIYENNIGHFLQVNKLDGSNQLKRAGRLVHKETLSLGHEPVDLGRWNRFFLDLSKLVEPDPGAIYRIELSFRKRYSLYPCENGDADEETVEDTEDEIDYESSYWDSYEEYYDEYYYYGDDGEYDWEQRDNPCSSSYYMHNNSVARNILASDLGIIAKSGSDQSVFVAVTSLVTAKPIQGVEVTLYDYQQQIIGTSTTDNLGLARVQISGKPFLLIARFEKQRGYLRLDDGTSLSLGAFDVSGSTVPQGLKAFLYGERGIWRPGDTLFLSCILEDRQKLLPPNHPVVFELNNPKGQLYARTTRTSGIHGFYAWKVPTSPDVLTGNWNLRVKVGGTVFSKNLKIESIKPNRLKIALKFDAQQLSVKSSDLIGDLTVTWLHGAIASNLRAAVSVSLTKAPTEFKKFPLYQFTDPAKSYMSEEQVLFDGYTNDAGKAMVPSEFESSSEAPGMLKANFTTRVFEKSGDFSIDYFSMPYSPYSAYVGLKTPEGDRRGMLLTDTTQWVDVVVVDENGNPVSRSNLEAEIFHLHWRNWWESADEELAGFMGNTYNQPLITKTFSAINGKGRFGFRIDRPEWGRFYIRVKDPLSHHSAGKIVYIDWPGWAGRPMRDNPEAASMLTFNADKERYQVGETAEIIIPASGNGSALLSIETGSRMLTREWIPVTGKEIRHTFTITSDMTPNVYVHVTLLQPHANSENDMPMRLYGVIPIFVDDPQTKVSPLIRMPEVLEPLQQFTIQVSEKQKREMTYTLALVEEGLLDLTRFKTPDPWNEFYAREALGVRTWDIYDMVIGAYGGKLAGILGIGGDEELTNGEPAEKANRFKPVVRFLGPFTLKAGKTNTHPLTMPNYIGSVRAMVVAGQDGAYGFAEKTVPVKKPLMVLATLPRVLGPGESVKLPVTVFAMDNQIKVVKVTVKTNGLMVAEEGTEKSVAFTQAGDQVIEFDMRIPAQTGVAKLQVTASSGKHMATYDLELTIRSPNPPVTTTIGGVSDPGKSTNLSFVLPGIENTNSARLEISGIFPIDAGRRLHYLITYPHGCIEQTASAAFAQLFLPDIMDLSDITRSAVDANIKAGIARLKKFQLSSGGFSYWPGQGTPDPWGSSYAGHFLIEAEKKGYALPAGLKKAWLKSQRQLARQWTPSQNDPYHQFDLEQAYRLFTLALAGEPDLSAMNRLREFKNLSLQAKWRLAATYALSGHSPVAKELVNRESTEIQSYAGLYSSYGSRERDWAMLLETMTIMQDKVQGATLARNISAVLSSDAWLSTQSTAYCLLAVAKFTKGISSGKLNFTYQLSGGKAIQVTSDKPVVQIPLSLSRKTRNGVIAINNQGKAMLFARVIMEGIPAAGDEKDFSNNLQVDVQYLTREGNPLNVSNLAQGTDFLAVVTVYNPGAMYCRDLALTQIFPPGWEIRNNRLADLDIPQGIAMPTYQDIRDDRIYTYFDLASGEKETFMVQLHAAYLGRYYLTGVYCEAMYDNSISAMKKGAWVEVTNTGK